MNLDLWGTALCVSVPISFHPGKGMFSGLATTWSAFMLGEFEEPLTMDSTDSFRNLAIVKNAIIWDSEVRFDPSIQNSPELLVAMQKNIPAKSSETLMLLAARMNLHTGGRLPAGINILSALGDPPTHLVLPR
jgi:hypothetical protein